jgi:hypothetical protein
MYRTRFELIRENPRGKRKINDSCYGGEIEEQKYTFLGE